MCHKMTLHSLFEQTYVERAKSWWRKDGLEEERADRQTSVGMDTKRRTLWSPREECTPPVIERETL